MTINIELSQLNEETRVLIASSITDNNSLSVLAKDFSWMVRQAVAKNESTPQDVLEQLGKENCLKL